MSDIIDITKLDDNDKVNKDESEDEHWKIIYTTIFLVGVFVFFWLLVAVFNPDETRTDEDIQITQVDDK